MKFRRLSIVFLISSLTCCNKAPSPESVPVAPSPAVIPTEAKPHVELKKTTTTPVSSPSQVAIDPKVTSSLHRVRVAFGGTAPSDFPAVLLHQLETVGLKTRINLRFVLTHLPGYEEPQLKSKGCKILVHRNKFDESGTKTGIGFPAWLVRIDATSKLALVGYVDEFPDTDDSGLPIEHETDGLQMTAIRTFLDTPIAVNGMETTYTHFFEGPGHAQQKLLRWAPFDMEAGECRNLKPSAGTLTLPEWAERNATNAPIVITSSDKIVGFVTIDAAHQARLIPVGKFDCTARMPSVAPVSAEFDTKGLMHVAAGFDPAGNLASEVHLLSDEVPSESFFLEHFKPNEGNQFAPIHNLRSNQVKTLSETKAGIGTAEIVFSLGLPAAEGEEKTYAVQLGLVCKGLPMTVSQPWLVKLRKQSDGVYPSIVGLKAASNKSGLQKEASTSATEAVRERHIVPDQKYALESNVRQIRPIKDGKELLFQFESAPYWKRFSLENETWLPLPDLDLSRVQLAGNHEAIFVLIPSSHEVRKYLGDALQLTATAHLEAEEDYFTLLAGSSSSNAPVFVLHPRGAAALSPHDLHRLDVPLYDGASGAPLRQYLPQEIYETSGDGRSIWTAHARLETYVDDLHGLQRNYFRFGAMPPILRAVSPAHFRVIEAH